MSETYHQRHNGLIHEMACITTGMAHSGCNVVYRLDCYTVQTCWQQDCQWDTPNWLLLPLMWLAGLNIDLGLTKTAMEFGQVAMHFGLTWLMEIPTISKGHW